MCYCFRRILIKISKKIFRLIIILLDFIFGWYHFFTKEEPLHLRITSFFKFIITGICNFLDLLGIACACKKKDNFTNDELLEEGNLILKNKEHEVLIVSSINSRAMDGNKEMKTLFSSLKIVTQKSNDLYN